MDIASPAKAQSALTLLQHVITLHCLFTDSNNNNNRSRLQGTLVHEASETWQRETSLTFPFEPLPPLLGRLALATPPAGALLAGQVVHFSNPIQPALRHAKWCPAARPVCLSQPAVMLILWPIWTTQQAHLAMHQDHWSRQCASLHASHRCEPMVVSAVPDALVTDGLPPLINAGAPALLVAKAGPPHLIEAGGPVLLVAEASGRPVGRSVPSITLLALCTAARCNETQETLSANKRLRLHHALSDLL